MTIQIELNPEMEAQLAAGARTHGVPMENYVQRLLQKALASQPVHRSRASQDEFRSFLDALAAKSPAAPQLRSETFSREMIYGEHA